MHRDWRNPELLSNRELLTPDRVVAFVLCGGLGTRLRSLTGEDIPKPLYPLVDRPIIEHSIEPLIDGGVSKVVLTTAYKDAAIRKHFQESYSLPDGLTTIDFTNQKEPAGVLPGIVMALGEHESSIADSIIVCDGDAIRSGLDIGALYAFHKKSRRNTTLVTTSVDQTERHWGVVSNSEHDLVEIDPFPPTGKVPRNVVFTGCMMLDSTAAAILREIPSDDTSWKGMMALLEQYGTVNCYESPIDYFNLNSPEIVEDAERMIRAMGRSGLNGVAESSQKDYELPLNEER